MSKNCNGAIGTFSNGVLRIIDNDKDFLSSEPTDAEGKKLSEDVIQAINNYEAAAAIDAPVKDEIMTGIWTT